MRTPVMLRWPGHTKAGRYDDLVSTIDLAPTILSACGLKPPRDMPGLNLLRVAAGKTRLKRRAVFGEIYLHSAVNLDQPSLSLTHLWVREGDWKLITFAAGSGEPELYNLAEDPREERNLAELKPGRVKRLDKILNKWSQHKK